MEPPPFILFDTLVLPLSPSSFSTALKSRTLNLNIHGPSLERMSTILCLYICTYANVCMCIVCILYTK